MSQKNLLKEVEEKLDLQRLSKFENIQASLKILKSVNDNTIRSEVNKLEASLKDVVQDSRNVLEQYVGQLKNFDQGIISKYGEKILRALEFGMLLAITVHTFFF